MEINAPSLTEFKTKYYINNSLKTVRIFKDKYITIFINLFFFLLFVGVVGGLLLYKYKGKLNYQEQIIKDRKKKKYLFQKLQQYSYDKEKASQRLITNLPLV